MLAFVRHETYCLTNCGATRVKYYLEKSSRVYSSYFSSRGPRHGKNSLRLVPPVCERVPSEERPSADAAGSQPIPCARYRRLPTDSSSKPLLPFGG